MLNLPIKSSIKLAILDVDGTLTKGNSWSRLHRYFGISEELEQLLIDRRVSNSISEQEWCNLVLEEYRKSDKYENAGINEVLSSFELRSGSENFVEQLKEAGIKIILLSCAPDVFLPFVAKTLDIQDYFGFYNIQIEDGKIINIISNLGGDESNAKLQFVKEHQLEESLDNSEILVVGDSENDLRLFEEYHCNISFDDASEVLKEKSETVVSDFDSIQIV